MTNTTNTRKPVARAAAKPAARPAVAKPAAKPAATKTVAAKAAPSKPAAKPAAKSPAKKAVVSRAAAKPAVAKAIKPAVEAPKRYKVLTGIDDSEFCARVSAVLDAGYELHGAPAATFNGKNVILAQAVVLKKLPAKKKAGKKK